MRPTFKTRFGVFLGVVATATIVSACGGQEQASNVNPQVSEPEEVVDAVAPTDTTIRIDGSSTVFPISGAIAKQYWAKESQTPVEVKFSGTSAGFQRFCAGETDISDASRPILVKEVEACNKTGVRFIELPIAFDALTLAVNPSNTWATDITVAELKKVWEPAAQGKITTWKQIRADYPDRPLNLLGAGKDSGTFDYFNEVLQGQPKQSRTDYTNSEDDNVLVEGIAKDPNALSYIPFSYYEANQKRLKALAIDHGKGAVSPARNTVENAQYQPFSRPLFLYINFKSTQSKPEVRAFVELYLKNAAAAATSVGYVPLPDEGYRLAGIQFQKGKVGTVFEGIPQPDVTIAELLRRQAVFQLTARTNQDSQPSAK